MIFKKQLNFLFNSTNVATRCFPGLVTKDCENVFDGL